MPRRRTSGATTMLLMYSLAHETQRSVQEKEALSQLLCTLPANVPCQAVWQSPLGFSFMSPAIGGVADAMRQIAALLDVPRASSDNLR